MRPTREDLHKAAENAKKAIDQNSMAQKDILLYSIMVIPYPTEESQNQ